LKIKDKLTSKKQDWRTPKWLVAACENLVGRKFDVDLAATAEDRVTEEFFVSDLFSDESLDSATAPFDDTECLFFMNPPFNRKGDFMLRLIELMSEGRLDSGVVILPTDYSIDFWTNLNNTPFIKTAIDVIGRIAFIDAETGKPVKGNTFGTTILFMSDGEKGIHVRKLVHRDVLEFLGKQELDSRGGITWVV